MSARHERAKAWLEERLSAVEAFGIAWATLIAFVRLVTNPRVFESPLRVEESASLPRRDWDDSRERADAHDSVMPSQRAAQSAVPARGTFFSEPNIMAM